VTFTLQPQAHFVGQHTVGAGMADEDRGRRLPRRRSQQQDVAPLSQAPSTSSRDRAGSSFFPSRSQRPQRRQALQTSRAPRSCRPSAPAPSSRLVGQTPDRSPDITSRSPTPTRLDSRHSLEIQIVQCSCSSVLIAIQDPAAPFRMPLAAASHGQGSRRLQ
jgi:hypothetical protein